MGGTGYLSSSDTRTAVKPTSDGSDRDKCVYIMAKRLFDIIFSLISLSFLLPFLATIAIAIIIDDFGDPFFIQSRVGKNGVIFNMIKFRSMYKNAEILRLSLEPQNLIKDGPIFKIKNDPRVTRVGRILRKTSLDELPQFINILAGSMSVVGPRPLIPDEQAKCTAVEANRLNITPGLTGLWQVSGRNDTTFREMMEFDLQYLHERCFFLDIKIIWKTVGAVLQSKGAY